jgi:hypothetical protein
MGRSITQEKTSFDHVLSTNKLRTEDVKTESRHRRFERTIFLIIFVAFFLAHRPAARASLAANDLNRAQFDVTSLERSRELIPKKKSLKGVSESQIVEYFQEHPESLKHDLAQVIRELKSQPKVIDTTKHVRLLPPKGVSGYEDLKIFVSHPYRIGDKSMPADDLVEVLKSAVRSAKKEIALNVYEFYLEDLAT